MQNITQNGALSFTRDIRPSFTGRPLLCMDWHRCIEDHSSTNHGKLVCCDKVAPADWSKRRSNRLCFLQERGCSLVERDHRTPTWYTWHNCVIREISRILLSIKPAKIAVVSIRLCLSQQNILQNCVNWLNFISAWSICNICSHYLTWLQFKWWMDNHR